LDARLELVADEEEIEGGRGDDDLCDSCVRDADISFDIVEEQLANIGI
jgi:hypothetical protein